jgi:hypothetical protein
MADSAIGFSNSSSEIVAKRRGDQPYYLRCPSSASIFGIDFSLMLRGQSAPGSTVGQAHCAE